MGHARRHDSVHKGRFTVVLLGFAVKCRDGTVPNFVAELLGALRHGKLGAGGDGLAEGQVGLVNLAGSKHRVGQRPDGTEQAGAPIHALQHCQNQQKHCE